MTTTSPTITDPSQATAEVPAILCPFTIVADVNEYLPQHNGYRFDCPLFANADKKYARIIVKTMTANLPAGDYTIFGMPSIIIERKTKADLYQSIGKRKNFIERLEMMQEIGRREVGGYAAVVVECNDVDLLKAPKFTKILPKSVSRTIISWRHQFNVDWWFLSDRHRAEVTTFRILESFHAKRAGKQP